MKTLNAKTCLRVAVLLAGVSCCVLTRAQTLTTLHNFTGANGHGELPYAQNLPMDANAAIYGTTAGGGSTQWGTVFQVARPTKQGGAWIENVIYTFQGNADGAQLQTGLVFDQKGNLYGGPCSAANQSACGGGCGTVYELAPPAKQGGSWTKTILHTFPGETNDGQNPGGYENLDRKRSLARFDLASLLNPRAGKKSDKDSKSSHHH
jgi:hypothetical protein